MEPEMIQPEPETIQPEPEPETVQPVQPVQPVAVAMIGDDDEAGADGGAGAGPPVQPVHLEPMTTETETVQPVSRSRR